MTKSRGAPKRSSRPPRYGQLALAALVARLDPNDLLSADDCQGTDSQPHDGGRGRVNLKCCLSGGLQASYARLFCRAEISDMSIGPIEKAFTCALRVSSRK